MSVSLFKIINSFKGCFFFKCLSSSSGLALHKYTVILSLKLKTVPELKAMNMKMKQNYSMTVIIKSISRGEGGRGGDSVTNVTNGQWECFCVYNSTKMCLNYAHGNHF